MAAHIHSVARQQPDRGRDDGAAPGPDLGRLATDPAAPGGRAARIAAERVRLFYQQGTPEGRRLVRHLHIVAVLGAASVGLVSWWGAGSRPGPIMVWCAVVCACETAITAVMRRFSARPRPDAELPRWAWMKAAVSACNGMAWSLGPILLYVPGQPLSILAPVWGILNYTGAAVWDGAYFAPSVVVMLAGVTLPAAVWLFLHGGPIGEITSLCLAVSLPFWIGLGLLSSRKLGEAIESRLEIADLLAIQTKQTRQIRDAQRERNDFFGAASHDLRQPLHALGFYVSLLPRAVDSGDHFEILARLSECAQSLDRQFNAIMGVAETDAAVEASAVSAIALQDVLERVIRTFKPEADLKQLRLRLVDTGHWASASPELLERVLGNLVSNAIKYTPAGGVLVGARRRGTEVALVVADTGIGIAEADLPNVFRDFFQSANPGRNRDRGFGLGLGIVRRLCHAMDWPIRVSSAVGRGSVFQIGLPYAAPGVRVAAAGERAPAGAIPTAGAMSVLFIDDDPLVRDAMGRLLADWQFAAELRDTGDEGIAVLRASPPGRRWHVLLDFRLAGEEDGIALADRIVAEFGGCVRVTMMSGEPDRRLIDGARSRAITLLRKPVKPIRLRAILTAP